MEGADWADPDSLHNQIWRPTVPECYSCLQHGKSGPDADFLYSGDDRGQICCSCNQSSSKYCSIYFKMGMLKSK